MDKDKGKLLNKKDLMFLRKLFSKNWMLLSVLPLLFYVIGYIYSYRLVDVYAARTQILLNSSETYDYQNSIYTGLGYYGIYADLTNQQRVLTSRDLIEKVVERIGFNVSYFIEGRIKTTEHFDNVPFEVEMKVINPKVYQVPIYFEFESLESYRLTYNLGGEDLEVIGKFNEYVKDELGNFNLKINKKRNITDDVLNQLSTVKYFFKVFNKGQLVAKFKNALKVENIEGTTILEVTLTDVLVKRAVMFLDTLNVVYQEYSLESEYSINKRTLFYIDKQLDTISVVLQELENSIDEYKEKKDIIDLTKEEALFFEKMTRFEADVRQEEIKIQNLNDLEEYIIELKETDNILPAAYYMLEEDNFLKKLIDQLYERQIVMSSILSSATEKNQSVQQLEQGMRLLKGNILELIANNRVALKQRKEKLQGEVDHYREKIKGIPKSQRDLLTIERERIVNERMYNFLLEKKVNTEITKLAIVPKSKVIERAQNAGIVAPNKNQIKLLFLLAGVLLAMVVAFIRVQFFSKIQSLTELKEATSIPIIGGISMLSENELNTIVLESTGKSSIAESFRGIRTNLEFLGKSDESSTQGKVILITSILPGEGKTFCSSNVATFLEKAHKKVVIIDFDLHKPKVHKRFEISNSSGLSAYLSGKIDEEGLYKRVKGFEDLMVINAGAIPPNPSEMVHSKKVAELIEKLKESYDYVIIDTPPIGLISDARVLMKYSDQNIFVVSAKMCTPRGVQFLESVAGEEEVGACSLVMNMIKQRKWRYYYSKYSYKYGYGNYGYGYGYGYGAGYGSDENDKEE